LQATFQICVTPQYPADFGLNPFWFVIIVTSCIPCISACTCSRRLKCGEGSTLAMPCTMLTIMPPLPLYLTSPSHHVLQPLLPLLNTLDMVSGQREDSTAQDTTWSPRLATPERAPAAPWTRQDTPSHGRLSPPLPLSLGTRDHHTPSYLLDKPIGRRSPGHRRHHQRSAAPVLRTLERC
jgi:hypothetical protein